MAPYFNQRVLQQILQTSILPWALSDDLLLTLAASDWPLPSGVVVTPEEKGPRSSRRLPKASQRDAPWVELGLHCRPHALLLFILEGEADIRIGRIHDAEPNEEGQGATGGRRKSQRSYEVSVYTLPERTCLIVPPDVAHSDGRTPHWERANPERARSQILWLQVLPTGIIIHICQTEGLEHTHTSVLFVRDLQVAPLTQFFLERAIHSPQPDALLSSFLVTIMHCVGQAQVGSLAPGEERPYFADDSHNGPETMQFSHDLQSEAFERACLYVGSHLTDALSPAQIARQTHISVSQLSRIFHARLGMPIMKYVTQRRLDEAKTLLLRTSLTTQEVGEICGYPHRTHFSRVFKEQVGSSPNAFRRAAALRNHENSSP
jgi:AraC-like DNA-binding protein